MSEHFSDKRILNEIEHGKYLAKNNAGEIWGWETPAGKLRWKRRVQMLINKITPDMTVLELGCGTGYFTKELIKTNSKIIAIDISSELLEIAKSNCYANNVHFLCDNAYNTNFDDETFDIIVGSSVLHHLDIDKALKEIYRLLKKGGSLKFTEPNMLNPQIALQKNIPYLKKKLGDSPDETAFVKWFLKKKLLYYGFSEIYIAPFDFLHPQTPRKLIPYIEKIGYKLENIPLIKEIAGSLFISAKKLN